MTELIHPTPLAWLALIAWPLVTALLFLRLPAAAAAAGAILGGELLLPELVSFDVVGFPPIDRTSVACVSVLAAALVFDRRALRSAASAAATAWSRIAFLARRLACDRSHDLAFGIEKVDRQGLRLRLQEIGDRRSIEPARGVGRLEHGDVA